MGEAAAAETLALAFADDPLMAWIFEDEAARPAQLRTWWSWIVANPPEHAELLATPDERSAAIWHGPELFDGSHPGDERRGVAFAQMLGDLVGGDVARRKLAGLAVIPAAHPSGRHWYLAAVGTRPEFQGTGSAVRVVRPVLDRCDELGLPAYLESSNPRNVTFYERLGFVVTGEIHIPDGPRLTAMWREPSTDGQV